MTPEVTVAAALLGGCRSGDPYRLSLDVPGDDVRLAVPRALYLAYSRSATLDYIGKVDRQAGAVRQRLREHTRTSGRKRSVWRWLWVIPVSASTTAGELADIERALIKTFRPPGNTQHARAA